MFANTELEHIQSALLNLPQEDKVAFSGLKELNVPEVVLDQQAATSKLFKRIN